ncbi:DUF4252 domain-containing protein [Chryseobacterium taklimakanense]|uniref:DUF4252 domain-containing protein n=1 Tax=Chryseobacterium taklimakanense TaxID=536441 RepID=UPI001EF56268|nr:DUF4252 domain-containing protein [Chryseobacterium taklimakanense]MCG7280941.1 DUF4252 domain-containing protein [Chryseobacterium taklimakanense]
MKKIFIILALAFSWFTNVSAQREKLYSLFDKYQETEGVTSIKIAKPMFSMLSKLDIKDAELDNIKPVLDKIQGLRILVIEKPESDSINKKAMLNFNSLQKDISSSLKNLNYDELMTVNSKEAKVKFLAADAANGVLDNLLLSVNSEGNQVLMMLDGKISMDDVNKLANETQTPTRTAPKNSTTIGSTSSAVTEEQRNVGRFSGIKVSSGIKLTFTQGNNQSVKVITDSDKMEYIKTELQGDILNVYADPPKGKNLNFKMIQVKITAPELSKIAVNSGASFTTENTVNSSFFQIAVSSGSHISADLNTKGKVELSTTSGSNAKLNINAKTLEMSATSGSNANLAGAIDETSFQVSSASSVNAQDLISKNSTVSASSAADLKVNVSGNLTVSGKSGATVRYRDHATVRRNAALSSGATVKSF